MIDLTGWEEEYNTGNALIDYQHKRLVRLINDLVELQTYEKSDPSFYDVIFSEIENYTKYHFKTEEEIMAHNQCPERAEHIILHKSFIEKLNQYGAGRRNKEDHHEFSSYLKSWLINHIKVEDKKFFR